MTINMIRNLLLTLLMFIGATAAAQTGLNVDSLFGGRYKKGKTSETVVKEGAIKDYGIDIYHSLTIKGAPAASADLERAVLADASGALSSEVNYKDGSLYYGFYELPSLQGKHRYLFYLNQYLRKGDSIILIYMEGDAGIKAIKRMLKQ